MRDFGRSLFAGLLATAGACQENVEVPGQPTSKGGPNGADSSTGTGASASSGGGAEVGETSTSGDERASMSAAETFGGSASSGSTSDSAGAVCGDSMIGDDEECDDGNGIDGDAASVTWRG